MREKVFLSMIFLLAVATDQASKLAVHSIFNLYDSRHILGNVLRLSYIRNSGAVFGMRFADPTVMLVLTGLVILLLAYLFITGKIETGNLAGKAALMLVLGGAIGNFIDRIRMREVIDFIDMGIGSYRWPTYNLADMYITVGMVVLIFYHLIFAVKPADSDGNPPETA